MKAGTDYQIVKFDPSRHTAFVFGTFRDSLHGGRDPQWPWKLIPWRLNVEKLKKLLIQPTTTVLVAETMGEPPVPVGWVAARPDDNEIVFSYVAHESRRFRIGTGLVTAAGVDLGRDVGVLFWTRAAQRISRLPKYRLYFRLTDKAEPAPVVAVPEKKGKAKAA